MSNKKRVSAFPVVRSFLEDIGGENTARLVQTYERDCALIKDDEMAKKMGLKVTDVRTILNRLHYRGIANYNKKRNKKTGWYSYTWAINKKRILELIVERQAEEIEKMQEKQENEEIYSFFSCKKGCHDFPFEIAAEYQFKCPECGRELNCIDSKKRNKQLVTKIGTMQREMILFNKLRR